MQRFAFYILLYLFTPLTAFSQLTFPVKERLDNINCTSYLSGTSVIVINTPVEFKNYMSSGRNGVSMFFWDMLYHTTKKYFKNLGYNAYFDYELNRNQFNSYCDIANVFISTAYTDSYLQNFSIYIVDCNFNYYAFIDQRKVYFNFGGLNNEQREASIKNEINAIFGSARYIFNPGKTLVLSGEHTNWTEEKIKKYLLDNNAGNGYQGIYEVRYNLNSESKYKIAIIKVGEYFDVIYLSGAINSDDWKEGDLKGRFYQTGDNLLLRGSWYMADKSENNSAYVQFGNASFQLYLDSGEPSTYLRLWPVNSNGGFEKSTGTGFAITTNGYIITNYHVIEGGGAISIRGINGQYEQSYTADVALADKTNDLAILKINDKMFTSFNQIPYVINSGMRLVGESVYVLGYPLLATMGEEIKLTDGIISAKSGFEGDITSYQITAPIQPGNSGSPVIDKNGNIIGIVNAKHSNTENVTYAIKSSYLLNLTVELGLNLNRSSLTDGMPITEIFKYIRNFVLIVEVN